jgi:HD-GYP domain-containing protein (c-di-GMP phosphodiesterase class II)
MTVRLRTRAFLVCFIPFAILLTGGFWMIQRLVQSTVRDGVLASLRENQVAIARVHSKSDLQNSRFLKVVGENAALKYGMQLLVAEPNNLNAHRTVEDQLRELGEHMGFDFLLVSDSDGKALAGVVRRAADASSTANELAPIDTARIEPHRNGMLLIDSRAFQVASVPIDQDQENLGSLSIGAYFDFSEFTTPAVLLHDGAVINSNIPNIPLNEIETALRGCSPQAECDLRLRGANWISLPIETSATGSDYLLRSLQNVDDAIGPVQSMLHNLFLLVALGSVLAAVLCSLISSRSIVKPIAGIVARLRTAGPTGVLPQFEDNSSSIREIRELISNYNRAAVAVRQARDNLQDAYIQFVGSLANALDARDHYTAGHSRRVSDLSTATAAAMGLSPRDVERIRVGALLHDIGKIGLADAVLQKPGRLTDEEFAQVKEHPVIGRRILEGVGGLAPFLDAVELHHENWDGSGYPKGQAGEATPIDARIIHVSDAYDAMTTDRSYRRGLTQQRAIEELRAFAGIQFDPRIVEAFASLPILAQQEEPQQEACGADLATLAGDEFRSQSAPTASGLRPVIRFEAWEPI